MANEPSRKYFERRFVVALVVAQIAGQNVSGDGADLQPDEDHDQLVGGGHHALPDDREQNQGVIFAGFGMFALQILIGAEHRQHTDADHQHAEESGEAVDDQHARRTRCPETVLAYDRRREMRAISVSQREVSEDPALAVVLCRQESLPAP